MNLEQYLQNFEPNAGLVLVGPFTPSTDSFPDPVIFIDGGSRCRKHNEGVSLGDGDSFDGRLDIQLNREKDFSDLAYALQNIPTRFSQIDLHGFLGGRTDHEMFNFGEVHRFLQSRHHPSKARFIHTGEEVVVAYSAGNWRFQHQGIFSLLAVENTHITLQGDCQYQCEDKTEIQPLSSLGLSNVANGTIYLQCDGPLFVLFQHSDA